MHDHFGALFFPMFWGLFALTIILTRNFTRHRERMRALEMGNKLAEKGLPIPPEMSEAMKPPVRLPPSPRSDIRTGAILIAVAMAILLVGFELTMGGPTAAMHGRFHPLYGIAAFPGLIGLVLIFFGLAGGRGRLGGQ